MKFILGLKLGMSQIFDEKGRKIPVTLIEAGPCQVTQIKTKEKDGYQAIQIGFKKIEKPKKPFKYLREFRNGEYRIGDKIDVSIFKEGDEVSVSGISKGKGFAGVVKRWGFRGRPSTHGTRHEERAPGAIGSSTPSRVTKGKKMAGRMGSKRITVKNLEIIEIDQLHNILKVKGAVPGKRGTLLEIKAKT